MSTDPPQMTAAEMAEASQRIVARERRRRLAAASERARLIAKAQRGGVKHPAGTTKATPSKAKRRSKAKAGRKASRANR
jgi:hypothetical protein